jgi:hypothetical protein
MRAEPMLRRVGLAPWPIRLFRGCDLVALRVEDKAHNGYAVDHAITRSLRRRMQETSEGS